MAQLVKRSALSMSSMNSVFVQIGMMCCLSLCSVLAMATQAVTPLKDPTRPADFAGAQGSNEEADQDVKLVLQSVLMSPKRQVAIINGQTVEKNGQIAGYRLLRLTETEALLAPVGERTNQKNSSTATLGKQLHGQTLTLKLFPEVEKKYHKK